jgi:nucleoid-associated protein YgaU
MGGLPLVKAVLQVMDGSKAGLILPVMFNPTEYNIERANSYKSTAVPGLGSPLIQFINGDAATLSMDLFIDDFTDGLSTPDSGILAGPPMPAVLRIEAIAALLNIDRQLHAPPHIRFLWGSLIFDAVLEKVGRKITMFHSTGIPARATLSVTFREYRRLSSQLDNPRRESSDKTKRRRITATDNVWSLADREYGDVRGWRQIASASDVDDPRDLRPGDWVKVPPVEDENAFASPR